MVSFPNCKINLGLNVIAKRPDGYHDLETVFYPVAINDVLEIIGSDHTELVVTGDTIDVPNKDNICIKAYELLKKKIPGLAPIKIHLHKCIPSGAGLGGGSADGAFTLRALNQKLELGLSTQHLIEYASELGSDCPFFIINKPCLATGRGERLEEVKLDLSAYKIFIVNPGIQIKTTRAFTQLRPAQPARSIKEIIKQPIATWKLTLKNDFESPVFASYPEIKSIKETFYNNGAVYSAMTGSGSTVFALFEKEKEHNFRFPRHYFTRELVC